MLVVPATKDIASWRPANNYRDAFVVIPSEYNQWAIGKIDASYGDTISFENHDWKLERRDTNNTVVSNYQYTHPGQSRHYTDTVVDLLVTTGDTINITAVPDPYAAFASGYTVTLYLYQPVLL